MSIGAASISFFAYGEGEWSLWVFTLLFTFMESIFPVGWATVGDFFGRKSFRDDPRHDEFFLFLGTCSGACHHRRGL